MHFPISKSFLQRNALAHQLEQEYGLENVNCQLITATLRDVYRVASSRGRHILYVYQHGQRSAREIAAEWLWVDYLYASGVPVAPAVPTRSGDCLLSFVAPEGIRYGVLTQFAEGELLRRRSSVPAVRTYGGIVAQIHALSDRMPFALQRPAIDFRAMLEQSVAAFEREVWDRPDDLAFLRASAKTLTSHLDQLPKEKPAYGMIHGDVIRANALVANDNRVTILDFDFCGDGWRTYDVASYLHTIRGTPDEPEFEQAFLEGYNAVRPLTTAEQATLPLFEAVRAIYSIGIPAMNIAHWGSRYFCSFVDNDLAALKNRMWHPEKSLSAGRRREPRRCFD
jgi:Ser/Thr protein kinase RdoA (MazF antagonist)